MERIENRMVVDSEWPSFRKRFSQCCECDRDIYEGEDLFNFGGDMVCEDCERDYVRSHFKIIAAFF